MYIVYVNMHNPYGCKEREGEKEKKSDYFHMHEPCLNYHF